MSDQRKPWLIRRGRAGRRPREVLHDVVDLPVGDGTVPLYVIVWETEHGPVLYYVPLKEHPGVTGEQVLGLLAPDRRADAVLINPFPVDAGAVPSVSVSPHGRYPAEQIGRALGADLPMWTSAYPAVETARAALAEPGRTVLLPDDSPWRWREARLLVGMRAGLPRAYPLAWAALAAEDGRVLDTILSGHDRVPDRGRGWYLAARPRRPQPPEPLSRLLAEATGRDEHAAERGRPPGRGERADVHGGPPAGRDERAAEHGGPAAGRGERAAMHGGPAAGRGERAAMHGGPAAGRDERAADEVVALRAAAAAMDRDDPRIEVYAAAAERLSHLLLRDRIAEITARVPESPHLDRVRAAAPITVTATWAGAVAGTWTRSLTPVDDLPALLRQHRTAQLLRFTRLGEEPDRPPWRTARPGEVRAAFRDRTGRYVLILADEGGPDPAPWMCAEWHRDPAVAATWTDATVLSADRPVPGGAAGPLLALTPESDGTVRADPFPAALDDGGPRTFEFGDRPEHRDAVRHVFRRLLSLALSPEDAAFARRDVVMDTLVEHPAMTLWPALAAPGDTLRLAWGTVRAAAEADVSGVRRLLAADAPRIHRYYAILEFATDPLDRLRQVVRRSATPDGWEVDEHVAPDGGWAPSNLLADIGRGRSYDEYRRLDPGEADRCVAVVRERWARRD